MAAEVIQKQPAAIQLRYLQTLMDIGGGKEYDHRVPPAYRYNYLWTFATEALERTEKMKNKETGEFELVVGNRPDHQRIFHSGIAPGGIFRHGVHCGARQIPTGAAHYHDGARARSPSCAQQPAAAPAQAPPADTRNESRAETPPNPQPRRPRPIARRNCSGTAAGGSGIDAGNVLASDGDKGSRGRARHATKHEGYGPACIAESRPQRFHAGAGRPLYRQPDHGKGQDATGKCGTAPGEAHTVTSDALVQIDGRAPRPRCPNGRARAARISNP